MCIYYCTKGNKGTIRLCCVALRPAVALHSWETELGTQWLRNLEVTRQKHQSKPAFHKSYTAWGLFCSKFQLAILHTWMTPRHFSDSYFSVCTLQFLNPSEHPLLPCKACSTVAATHMQAYKEYIIFWTHLISLKKELLVVKTFIMKSETVLICFKRFIKEAFPPVFPAGILVANLLPTCSLGSTLYDAN